MIKLLRKKRVVPETDQYISQRYEDTAVTIYFSIKAGNGVYSAFVPWIQSMLVRYITSDEIREKHWHDQVPLYYNNTNTQQVNSQAWTGPVAEIENTVENTVENASSTHIAMITEETCSPEPVTIVVPIINEQNHLSQNLSVNKTNTPVIIIDNNHSLPLRLPADQHICEQRLNQTTNIPQAKSKLCTIL